MPDGSCLLTAHHLLAGTAAVQKPELGNRWLLSTFITSYQFGGSFYAQSLRTIFRTDAAQRVYCNDWQSRRRGTWACATTRDDPCHLSDNARCRAQTSPTLGKWSGTNLLTPFRSRLFLRSFLSLSISASVANLIRFNTAPSQYGGFNERGSLISSNFLHFPRN